MWVFFSSKRNPIDDLTDLGLLQTCHISARCYNCTTAIIFYSWRSCMSETMFFEASSCSCTQEIINIEFTQYKISNIISQNNKTYIDAGCITSKLECECIIFVHKYLRQFCISYWWRARHVGVFKRFIITNDQLELFLTGCFPGVIDLTVPFWPMNTKIHTCTTTNVHKCISENCCAVKKMQYTRTELLKGKNAENR